jgi:hypothetical protein
LQWAVKGGHENVVEALLEKKELEVDGKGADERTTLWWAEASVHNGIVEALIATGETEIDAKDKFGWTPLMRAAMIGYVDVVRTLLTMGKADADVEDMEGMTPLQWAKTSGTRWWSKVFVFCSKSFSKSTIQALTAVTCVTCEETRATIHFQPAALRVDHLMRCKETHD